MEDAQAMRQQWSPSTRRRYPLTMICQVYRLARSTVYAATAGPAERVRQKRGPKTAWADAAVLETIHAVLAACPFYGEGYRKIRARLAHQGLRVGGKRVLRLMRAHGLLAPRRLGPPNGNPAHDGHIITDRPDVMWGTDGTRFYTVQAGWCWFFGVVDHHTDEVMGWHVAKYGDRWAALEPIRQGIKAVFGAASPSYVGEPQCNGVAERFMRTLKEQCLYLHQFETLEQARQSISEFTGRYNTQWLIERLGHRTPAQVRAEALTPRAA